MKLSLLHKKYLQKLIKCTKFDENNTTNKKCVLQYVIKLLDYSIPDTDYIKPTCDFLTDHIQLWILLVVAKFGYLSHAVPQTDREKIMFSALFRSIANSMYSILVLSKKGLDYSAQSLLRTLMEQFFVLLSVTNDRDKRMAYLDNYGGKDANTSWYKNFKKEKFIAMIKEYFDDDFLKKQFIELVNSEYSDYSSFIHNDYINTLCYSMVYLDDKKTYPNLCGRYVTREKEINTNCFVNSFLMAEIFYHMVREPKVDFSLYSVLEINNQTDLELIRKLYILQKNLGIIIASELQGGNNSCPPTSHT